MRKPLEPKRLAVAAAVVLAVAFVVVELVNAVDRHRFFQQLRDFDPDAFAKELRAYVDSQRPAGPEPRADIV